ncbi:MAG: glycosyl hydrolase family 18 protein [Chloroflexota bacterium]
MLLVVLASWLIAVQRKYPTASPFVSSWYLLRHAGQSHPALKGQVVGFLPYWQTKQYGEYRLNSLSEVVFFSLTANSSGQLVRSASGKPDPGWQAWSSASVRNDIARTEISGTRMALSVALQNGVQLGALLNDSAAQQRLIGQLVAQVAGNRLDGLNLDFEFSGASTPQHRQVFTSFVGNLASALHERAPEADLSIDLPPTSAGKAGLYDVPSLARVVSRVIVMSYDYYTAAGNAAGPVAPMAGYASGEFFFDVSTTYQQYLAAAPAAKLLMGVPVYGYDWPVKDNGQPVSELAPQADGSPSLGEVVSYSRMRADPRYSGSNCHWEATAQEERCAYTDPTTHEQREAWLETNRSLALKLAFAQQHHLAGVALWTPGYAGSYPDPWNLLQHSFGSS